MGILSFFEKRRKEPHPGESDEWVTLHVKKSEIEAVEERLLEIEEDHRRHIDELENQQELRRSALQSLGVSTDLITVSKGRNDLREIADLCELDMKSLGRRANEGVFWQPLTRTGKVPKCVATYNTHWDLRKGGFSGGLVTCEVGYLADGTPYTAWINDLRAGGMYYKVKAVDGKLALIAETPA